MQIGTGTGMGSWVHMHQLYYKSCVMNSVKLEQSEDGLTLFECAQLCMKCWDSNSRLCCIILCNAYLHVVQRQVRASCGNDSEGLGYDILLGML